MTQSYGTPVSPRKILAVTITLLLTLAALILPFQIFEYLDARNILVVQYPSGTLVCHATPGIKQQRFGTVTEYKKRDQFWFSAAIDQGKKQDESIPVRFNDGGHAKISGSISWEMPEGCESVIRLHTLYGSHHAIEQQIVRTVLEKAVYMTGPLMSSAESYAVKRNELLSLIDDQLIHGVYRTETKQVHQPDPMTGQIRTVSVVTLVMEGGKHTRADRSPLEEFGIKTSNLSVNQITYDPIVEEQIKQQQQAIMQVQTAVAEAKQAEQRAITVAKEGEANAAKAKWEQEVIKAQQVTQAEQRLKVAELEATAAEQTKRAQILIGEGEAERKRLVMEADGALQLKLDALIQIHSRYADAIKEYKGNWVPNVVMGQSTNAQPGSGAQAMIDFLTVHFAQQLGVNLGVSGIGKTGADNTAPPPVAAGATSGGKK